MADNILAHVSHTCDHDHRGHSVEIYAERGDPERGDSATYYLTAIVTEDGEASGFGIPMEKTHLATFAWSILRELEGLSGDL
jgi:hypothetical protein